MKSLDARGLLYIVMLSRNASLPIHVGLWRSFLNSYSLHVVTCVEPANRHFKGRTLQERKKRDNVLITWHGCAFALPLLSWKNSINLFKVYCLRAPAGLTPKNSTLCPHHIYVFCIHLRTNSDLCHLQHKLIGFYNRDENCLLRGTDWVLK